MEVEIVIDGVTYYAYLSVAEAEILIVSELNDSRRRVWDDLDETLKAEKLVGGASYIDSHLVFKGTRSASPPAQHLEWPRDNVEVFGVIEPDGFFPLQLKAANLAVVIHSLQNPDATLPPLQNQGIVKSRTRDGDQTTYETGSHLIVRDTRIYKDDISLALLDPFLAQVPEHLHPIAPGTGESRLIRSGSGFADLSSDYPDRAARIV